MVVNGRIEEIGKEGDEMKISAKKKVFRLLFALLLTISFSSFANNLLLHGDLEGVNSDELYDYFRPYHGHGEAVANSLAECSLHQENDGNHCLKFTFIDYRYYGTNP